MLVAHQEDHITHAVIGGKKQINFGISDDPAFFQILSSSLYKDPMLAMVRETICNAWDAHIESCRVDQPITITLDDDYLIIRDYGYGIPDSMIGPIYGVYGASTKKNDGRQTGGFGLGCKSPFAYTDHFEVTSYHNGTKTIYNMSKSSSEVMGKPSIIPIASFPTSESGISVKIPLNPDKNNLRLESLIEQVVFNGDILAMFNQTQLPILGLDTSESGLVLINDRGNSNINMPQFAKHRIFVRYGNVIYPIERADSYNALFDKVQNLLDRYYSCRLVLLADPDTISITPSRESLTLSDITVETVKSLLTKFLAVFFKNQELMTQHKELVAGYVDQAAMEIAPLRMKLPLDSWMVPGIPDYTGEKILKSTSNFALLEVLLRYGGQRGSIKSKIWFKYIMQYLWKIAEEGNIDKGLLHRWMRTTQRNIKRLESPSGYHNRHSREVKIATDWWQKNVLAPLVQNLMEVIPSFKRKDLYYTSPNIDDSHHAWGEMSPVGKVKILNHTRNLLHMIQPTVILAHNAKHLIRRLRSVDRDTLSSKGTIFKDTYFALEIERKGNSAEIALQQLMKIPNIKVIDMTGRTAYEQELYEERQAAIAKARADAAAGKVVNTSIVKKNKPGLIQFDFILDIPNKRIDTKIISDSIDPNRITNPEFVALVSTGKNNRHETDRMSKEVLFAIGMLYGKVGAVTNKQDAYERYKENGAVDISEYVMTKIIADVQTLPALLEYQKSCYEKVNEYIEGEVHWQDRKGITNAYKMLLDNPVLNHLIPGLVTLSDEDNYRWIIWKHLEDNYRYSRNKEYLAAKEKVDSNAIKPEIKNFLDKLIANPFLGLIDIDVASQLLISNRNDPDATTKIVSFIEAIIK